MKKVNEVKHTTVEEKMEIRAQDESRRRQREELEMEQEMVEYYRYLAEQDAREQY